MHIRFRAAALALALIVFFVFVSSAFAEELSPGALVSEAAICIDAETGAVLFGKNPDAAMYPASTTKIMTCLLAIESGRLYETVVIPAEAAQVPKDSSLTPVVVGEEMQFIDLLYGFMLRSGNDAGNAIAVLVSGSLDSFVARMNARAAELGMTGTRFANPHGYHEDNHYTTARDLATLTQAAMQNETFREIVSTPGYIIPPTNKRDTNLKLVNSNLMLLSNSEYYYPDVIGVKTGFTNAAGQTFVVAAERDGAMVIGVLMKSGTSSEAVERWTDTKALLDYAFTRYTSYSFSDLYALSPAIVMVNDAALDDPFGGELQLSAVSLTGSYTASCVDGDIDPLLERFRSGRQYAISADLTAPIAAGTIIGTLTFTSADGQSVTATLVASRDVAEEPDPLTLGDIFPFLQGVNWQTAATIAKIGAAVLVLLFLLNAIARIRRSRRRRRARRVQPDVYRRSSYYR